MPKIVVLLFLVGLFFFFLRVSPTFAFYDPRTQPNNIFGMHIIDENDLDDASRLVNSTGGDWGYVKIVIREDDRNLEKWQMIFDRMRHLHVIPIVRIATTTEHGYWRKPRTEDIGSWVDFLNSLNWVTENRYVVIFNEPNHASEWGNDLNPEEYGWYLKEYSRRLKEKSPDFFILPAGLDTSADNFGGTIDAERFISRMVAKEPDVFDFIDGWTSHSYPNPGFIGSPTATGKGTVRSFLWEKQLLEKYTHKTFPIFILETGWQHSEGKEHTPRYPTPETVATYYQTAFASAWQHPDIVAVVPFLLNYQDAPFDHFSWKKLNSSQFYAFHETVRQIPKTAGKPKQYHQVRLLTDNFPDTLVVNSSYTLNIEIENLGQSILDQTWDINMAEVPQNFKITVGSAQTTLPFHRTRVPILVETPRDTGKFELVLKVKKDGQEIAQMVRPVILIPPPSLLLNGKIWFNKPANGTDFGVIMYDEQQNLLYAHTNVDFKDGYADIENLYNVVPNGNYRVVLTKPYYLPRQVYVTISGTKTGVVFPPLLPLDPSGDGKFSSQDIQAFFRRPLKTVGLLLAL